ncbi:ABC transporter ATP-binding protein [Flavobacterium enshiense]|uniref:ABC transporter ATP-binding protein n=1 Tax=Flavobacterium enshiense TaxID=1341165 RepID=UPI00345D0044
MEEKDIILKVENISKQYRLGTVGTGTLSHDLNRWWHAIRGKEDPYLKVGETNDRTRKGDSEYVWALQDINFEVERGEVLGVIGKNGAGKSTLLKILSKVTAPTTGTIKSRGRIASLLEVGTGFNPELTGRENVYLNGAILGMTKKEIASKMDEIIAFSGCERYIDTPTKRYSSGMTVRLAFAVAAFLEPEILIVDEVLAVGDVEFQKKAIGKMKDISRGEGRTVLFVSHNMEAIKSLCSKLIIVKNGMISFNGEVDQGVSNYLKDNETNLIVNIEQFIETTEDKDFRLLRCDVYQKNADELNFVSDEDVLVEYEFEVLNRIKGLRVGFDLIDLSSDHVVFRTFHDDTSDDIQYTDSGVYKAIGKIPSNFLRSGLYSIRIAIGIHAVRWIANSNDLGVNFLVYNSKGVNKAYKDNRPGLIMPEITWVTEQKK